MRRHWRAVVSILRVRTTIPSTTTKVGNDAVTVFVVMNSARAFRKLVAQVDEILSKAQFGGQPYLVARERSLHA